MLFQFLEIDFGDLTKGGPNYFGKLPVRPQIKRTIPIIEALIAGQGYS